METVRENQQLHGTGETVKDSQHPREKVSYMHQLHGTERDSERKPATIGDRERQADTPWYCERQ